MNWEATNHLKPGDTLYSLGLLGMVYRQGRRSLRDKKDTKYTVERIDYHLESKTPSSRDQIWIKEVSGYLRRYNLPEYMYLEHPFVTLVKNVTRTTS